MCCSISQVKEIAWVYRRYAKREEDLRSDRAWCYGTYGACTWSDLKAEAPLPATSNRLIVLHTTCGVYSRYKHSHRLYKHRHKHNTDNDTDTTTRTTLYVKSASTDAADALPSSPRTISPPDVFLSLSWGNWISKKFPLPRRPVCGLHAGGALGLFRLGGMVVISECLILL